MDTYGGGLGVLWLAIFETVVISWIYGVQRFADDMGFMLNTKINIYWKVSLMPQLSNINLSQFMHVNFRSVGQLFPLF
jgi:hypothetical protein